jgi:hypothetical protein
MYKHGFVITIGNYGAVIALHKNNDIKNRIFLEELSDEFKGEIKKLLSNHKSCPIYILLDTVDQAYRKKTYPSAKKQDLIRLITRDINSDSDKESIKNYIISDKKSSTSKSECLFISSSVSENIRNWIEFLLEMPNRLVGIYMLPVESFSLFKMIEKDLKSNIKERVRKNKLYCFILQNKVSGIRQIVFSEQGIVFTRVVNYDFEEGDFLEKYEQDVYSTFEYLKRVILDVSLSDIDIINIMSEEVLKKISTLQNLDFNFINYTPFRLASLTAHKSLVSENSNYCDLLVSKAFFDKKILKFTTPKISQFEKMFLIISALRRVSLATLAMISVSMIFILYINLSLEENISAAQKEELSAKRELERIKTATLDGDTISENNEIVDVERILDIGKSHEVLGNIGLNIVDNYIKLNFVRENGMKLDNFSYSLMGFNEKNPTQNTPYKMSFSGNILNKSGDIENLFRQFDGLTAEVKKTFDGKKITYSELPRNIDFSSKYYDFKVNFSISNQ